MARMRTSRLYCLHVAICRVSCEVLVVAVLEMSKEKFEEYLARTFPDDDKRSTSGVIHRKLGQGLSSWKRPVF